MMDQKTEAILDTLINRYPTLVYCRDEINTAFLLLAQCYEKGGKALICGNGGSAADAEHIVGELMKGFLLKRKIDDEDRERLRDQCPDHWRYIADNLQGALPAVSLVSQTALIHAYANDMAPDMAFAQQVYGYVREGDAVIGISTSGHSQNVIYAIQVARAFGAVTIGLTGGSGGALRDICDCAIAVPETETLKVQELHLPVYHALCAMVESAFFKS